MSCEPESVTGYVDGALDAASHATMQDHLALCGACREQAEAEALLRARLRALPAVELPAGVAEAVRRRLRPPRLQRLRWAAPLAAALAGVIFWARGAAPLVSWELARHHARCFRARTLPALVWSEDPVFVMRWFESRGTELPLLPAAVGGLQLVGGRHCSLPDGSRAAHLYYVGHHGSHLSALVLDRNVRLGDGHSVRSAGSVVHLMRAARMTVGIVSEERDPVEAFRRALFTMAARGPDRRRGGSPRNPRSAVALPLELLTVGGPSDIFAVSAVGL